MDFILKLIIIWLLVECFVKLTKILYVLNGGCL